MRLAARLIALACLIAVALSTQAGARPLTVFGAASLKETLDEAAALYARSGGGPVRVAYGASSALARQIEDGAPADVFVSADRDWMDALQAKGLIDTRTRRDVAGNALVLVVPAASPARAIALRRGVDLRPVLGRDGRIALALTGSVPAGKYGKAALQSLDAWSMLQPRVVEAENVRAALQLVARGEAALGVVYASDARAEPRVRVVAHFAPSLHPRIVYPAARLRASTHPRSAAFVAWLASPAGQAVFRRHGFVPAR